VSIAGIYSVTSDYLDADPLPLARFYVYSRTELPVRASSNSRSSTPSPSFRESCHRQPQYIRSPLSSPTASETGSITSLHIRGRSFDAIPVNSPIPKEPYNALVMQRLGRDIGSMFQKHISQAKLNDTASQPSQSPVHPSSLKRQGSSRARPTLHGCASSHDLGRHGWDIDTVVWIGSHLLKALEIMHNRGYIHRDVVSVGQTRTFQSTASDRRGQ
jgi:hypothetical protein